MWKHVNGKCCVPQKTFLWHVNIPTRFMLITSNGHHCHVLVTVVVHAKKVESLTVGAFVTMMATGTYQHQRCWQNPTLETVACNS